MRRSGGRQRREREVVGVLEHEQPAARLKHPAGLAEQQLDVDVVPRHPVEKERRERGVGKGQPGGAAAAFQRRGFAQAVHPIRRPHARPDRRRTRPGPARHRRPRRWRRQRGHFAVGIGRGGARVQRSRRERRGGNGMHGRRLWTRSLAAPQWDLSHNDPIGCKWDAEGLPSAPCSPCPPALPSMRVSRRSPRASAVAPATRRCSRRSRPSAAPREWPSRPSAAAPSTTASSFPRLRFGGRVTTQTVERVRAFIGHHDPSPRRRRRPTGPSFLPG